LANTGAGRDDLSVATLSRYGGQSELRVLDELITGSAGVGARSSWAVR
jgi:hypothetical protein